MGIFLSFGFGTRPSPVVPAPTSFNPDLLRNAGQPISSADLNPSRVHFHLEVRSLLDSRSGHGPDWYGRCLFRVLSTSVWLPNLGGEGCFLDTGQHGGGEDLL